jgi:hypothetical protein
MRGMALKTFALGLLTSTLAHASPAPLGSGVDPTPPGSFLSAGKMANLNYFTSCMAPLAQSFAKNKKKLYTVNTQCPEVPVPADAADLKCELFQENDVFVQRLFDQKMKEFDDAKDALACRQGVFDAAQGELKCMQQQADMLSQQIASVQSVYQQNITRMQQDVQQMNSTMTDRQAQMNEVLLRLNGNDKTGQLGIRQMAEQTQALIAAMPAEIEQVRGQQQVIEDKRKILTEQIQSRTMALAGECFTTRKDPTYRCVRNGPTVSAKEYVLCRYQQNQMLTDSGQQLTDKTSQKMAEGARQGLEALLDQIFGDSPKATKQPSNQAEAEAARDQPVGVLSVADVEDQYGSKLAGFNGKGLDIHSFIIKAMGSCFNRATQTVTTEENRSGSQIGRAKAEIKQNEESTKSMVSSLLSKYTLHYSQAMRSLTGMQLPVNASACNSAKPSVQLGCLKDIQNNMQGMLSGTTTNAAVAMIVRAPSNPSLNVTLKCVGLNDCAQKMQNMGNSLNQETQRIDAAKKKYVQQANQNLQTYTKNMAQMMSQSSAALQNQLKAINGALSRLHVSSLIDIKPLEGDEPEFDQDGLMKPPKNALKLIGAQVNPPMLDVGGNNFSDALKGVGDATKDLGKDLADVDRGRTKLQALKQSCKNQAAKDAYKDAEAAFREFSGLDCAKLGSRCGNEASVQNLIQVWSHVDAGSGLSPNALDRLGSGIDMSCRSLPDGIQGSFDRRLADLDHRIDLEQKRLEKIPDDAPGKNTATLTTLQSQRSDLAEKQETLSNQCRTSLQAVDKAYSALGEKLRNGAAGGAD